MADTTDITMYTSDPCPFCRQAKALLEARGVEYDEVNLSMDSAGRADLVARTGRMTFPQIIVADRPIGGFQELLAADRDGSLTELLAA
jgi:glutaredoxin 3